MEVAVVVMQGDVIAKLMVLRHHVLQTEYGVVLMQVLGF